MSDEWKDVDRVALKAACYALIADPSPRPLFVVGDDFSARHIAADVTEKFLNAAGYETIRIRSVVEEPDALRVALCELWRNVECAEGPHVFPRSVALGGNLACGEIINEVLGLLQDGRRPKLAIVFDTVDEHGHLSKEDQAALSRLGKKLQRPIVLMSREESKSFLSSKLFSIYRLRPMAVIEIESSLKTSKEYLHMSPSIIKSTIAEIEQLSIDGEIFAQEAYELICDAWSVQNS